MADLPSSTIEGGETEQQEEMLDNNNDTDGDGDGEGSIGRSSSSTRRLIRFACFAFMFWLVVLFLVYEHEERVLILVLVALCLVLTYLTVSICYMIGTTPEFRDLMLLPNNLMPSSGRRSKSSNDNDNIIINNNDDDADGRSGLLRIRTSSTPAGTTRDIEDGNNDFDDGCSNDDDIFRFSFEDTALQVRSLSSSSSIQRQSQPPRDGTYKVVYTAIVFGKPIRSEGFLELKFKNGDDDDDNNNRRRGSSGGWDIEGVSLFGGRSSSQTIIQDGYLNSEGQMYWIVPMVVKPPPTRNDHDDAAAATAAAAASASDVVVVYRGVFDFDQCCLTDGEFQSINDDDRTSYNNIHNDSTKTKGRIVRLEWAKENSMIHHEQIGTTGRGGDDGRVEMEMTELRQQNEGRTIV